jgi:adenylosuccinate synthase
MPMKDYVDYLERKLNLPVKMVSTGPDRIQTIFR